MRWLTVALVALTVVAIAMVSSRNAVASGGRPGSARTVNASSEVAKSISEATGLAISPLLVLTCEGIYNDLRLFDASPAARASLPWYASRWFWIPATLVLLLVLFKEAILGRAIALKKPLDQLELIENMASGIIASPVAIQALTGVFEPDTARALAWINHIVLPVAQAASETGVVAPSGLGAIAWVFAAIGGLILFTSLWMLSQSINVLLLLSPLGIIDNVVRIGRLLLLALVMGLIATFPQIGIGVCVLLCLVALAVSGWSFRLMVFGAVLSRDTLFHRKAQPEGGAVWAFSSTAARAIPPRTYGTLAVGANGLEFSYRRWMVLPRRTIQIPGGHVEVAAALLSPVIVRIKDPGPYETLEQLFRLPPRYKEREVEVANALGGLSQRDAPLVRGLKAIRAWISAFVNEGTIHLGL